MLNTEKWAMGGHDHELGRGDGKCRRLGWVL